MAPVAAVYLGYYYVSRAPVRQFLEGKMLSFTIIDSLESIDEMRGDTSAMDAVIWAAGRFVLRLIAKAEASAAERDQTHVQARTRHCTACRGIHGL
jgi:hypothetical protein